MKIIKILFLSFLLYSCNTVKSVKNTKIYFEGTIIYSLEYKPSSPQFSNEDIKELIGTKMIFTFKNGSYKKMFYSPDGELISIRVLDLVEKKSYMQRMESDTAYWFDITVRDTKSTFKKYTDSTLLKVPVKRIEVQSSFILDPNQENLKFNNTYYIAKLIKINPEWFSEFKEGDYNELVKIADGITLKGISEGLYWDQIITATEIKHHIVEEEIKFIPSAITTLKEL
jgi:hypothetical protein